MYIHVDPFFVADTPCYLKAVHSFHVHMFSDLLLKRKLHSFDRICYTEATK